MESPEEALIDRVDPLPERRRKCGSLWWAAEWVGNAVNLFVVGLVVFVGELGLTLYMVPIYDGSWLFWFFGRFLEFNIVANLFAIRWNAHKDNAHYQLRRLRISSKRLVMLASQTTHDEFGNTVPAYKTCDLCDRNVPMRSVHCPFCGVCSLRNDHHCFATGACIGIATTRYFTMLGFYLTIIGSWGMFCFVEFHRVKTNDADWFLKLMSYWDVIWDLIGVHALGFNIFKWWIQGYVLTWSVLAHWAVYLLSVMAFISGSSVFVMQIFFTCKGFGMMEWILMRKILKGERDSSLANRLAFVHGRQWYLNWVFPRIWEDVDWRDEFRRSLITEPFRKPNEETTI